MKLYLALALCWLSASSVLALTQTHIVGPPGSGSFGQSVTVLPNGNFVVVDSGFDQVIPAVANVGAVYLYSTQGVLISTLKGSNASDAVGSSGVTLLANGNFVVRSGLWRNGGVVAAGAVTWGNAYTGFIGGANVVVSAANSLVGSSANDNVGSNEVTVLSNGNYVVSSPSWDQPAPLVSNVGAVTWGNGSTGIVGQVTAANSLIGSSANDLVGNNGVTVLTNSNYVVSSQSWDQPLPLVGNVGAMTWGNGSKGIVGPVSASNSLIGSTANDNVGLSGVTVLSNGNYVVSSPFWDQPSPLVGDVGALTWGNGSMGITGPVSAANSLVGSTAIDQVGSSVTALSNGNYVVISPNWDQPSPLVSGVGALTWGNGSTGITGPVSAANSLVGSTANDNVGINGVTALTNGNYVVNSSFWDQPSPLVVDVGALTWGNGSTGITGPVSAANSLVGSTANDSLGSSGVTALTNGNYVVRSPNWDQPSPLVSGVGAVSWGNGKTGTKGKVSASNSLVGSTANDNVGGNEVTALSNGNYVVSSAFWDQPSPLVGNVGAVTWGNGSTGIAGSVSAANSLFGSTVNDFVGSHGVTVLSNGNYVARSVFWDQPSLLGVDVGAVTWGNGSSGIKGKVSAANSLVGSSAADRVGLDGVVVLRKGNYVVRSGDWKNDSAALAGAVTWGNGQTGIQGVVSPQNSLIGSSPNDSLGLAGNVIALSNGDYAVMGGFWSNPQPPGTPASGCAALCNGTLGTVGPIHPSNSVLGVAANGGLQIVVSFDAEHEQLVVGRRADNTVTLLGNFLPRSLAKSGAAAPGAAGIAFASAGATAVNAVGGTLSDYTLSGSGAAVGKNRAIFAAPPVLAPLELVLQSGTPVSTLGAGLPENAKATALFSLLTQQSGRALFQATVSGTGITTSNNRLLLLDNGASVAPLLRTGQPLALLSNASISIFREVLQSHQLNLITLSYQLQAGSLPLVNINNDTGLLPFRHDGSVINNNISVREGSSAVSFGGIGTFGQFTGRAAINTSDEILFAAFLKIGVSSRLALFSMEEDGGDRARKALAGDPAPGAAPATFGSFPAFSLLSSSPLFKATLNGVPTATNEGLWRGTTLLLRKGDAVTGLAGVTITSLFKFWPAGSGQVLVQVKLAGSGVTAANNQALLLRQADGQHLVLARTGFPMNGTGTAKLSTLSAIDVNPIDGRYAVVGTLSNTSAAANLALWTGNTSLGGDAVPLLQAQRLPVLRLRKGERYSTSYTPLGVIKSLSIKPAIEASGAGGRGLAQAIGSAGHLAVYLLNDASATELLMLPP